MSVIVWSRAQPTLVSKTERFVQDMGNGVTVEELMRTVEDLSRSCH